MGDALTVDQLGARFDLAPSEFARKGDHIRGNPQYALHETNIWSWSVTSMHKVPLENQLALALDVLEPRIDRVREVLRETGARAELFVGYGAADGQGDIRFSPALLTRLSKLGLPLDFDLYSWSSH